MKRGPRLYKEDSHYPHVYYHKEVKGPNKWEARIKSLGKEGQMGMHPTEERAYQAVLAFLEERREKEGTYAHNAY